MASSMQYYTITIINTYSNFAPGDGFIDPMRIENYYSYNNYAVTNFYSSAATQYAFETTPASLTLALCTAKRRANYRWNEMIRQLQLVSNCWIDPNTINATGGSAPGWTPTAITFQLVGLFGDAAWITADETNPGQSLTSLACIQRCIARALISDDSRQMDVFNPTSTNALFPSGNAASANRTGITTGTLEIGAYASDLASANAVISVITPLTISSGIGALAVGPPKLVGSAAVGGAKIGGPGVTPPNIVGNAAVGGAKTGSPQVAPPNINSAGVGGTGTVTVTHT